VIITSLGFLTDYLPQDVYGQLIQLLNGLRKIDRPNSLTIQFKMCMFNQILINK